MINDLSSLEAKQEWNDFVSNCPWSDILQYWQWGEVKTLEGWEYGFITSDDDIVRSMFLIKRAPGLGNYMYIPHGPVFHSLDDLRNSVLSWKNNILKVAKEKNCFVIEIDPKIGELTENEDLNEIQKKNVDSLSHFFNKDIIEEFKRNGFQRTSRNMQPIYKLLYSLELSPDELMSLMSKSTRYNVRYAEKNGVEVKEYSPDDPQIEERVKEFYKLLEVTQERAGGYPIRPFSTFQKLFEVFKGTQDISLFEVSYQGDVIAFNISQRTQCWSSSFYASSNRLHSKLKAPYLLRWASIMRAKEFGSDVYDFWGIIPDSKQHKGYSDHKLGFGGARIDHIGIMQMPLNSFKTVIFNRVLPLRSKFAELKRNYL